MTSSADPFPSAPRAACGRFRSSSNRRGCGRHRRSRYRKTSLLRGFQDSGRKWAWGNAEASPRHLQCWLVAKRRPTLMKSRMRNKTDSRLGWRHVSQPRVFRCMAGDFARSGGRAGRIPPGPDPLDADAMAGLSRQTRIPGPRPRPEDPGRAHRAAAQMLALAMALDPANNNARDPDFRISRNNGISRTPMRTGWKKPARGSGNTSPGWRRRKPETKAMLSPHA